MQPGYKYSFENLEVWQLSRKLVEKVYRLAKDFPADELYGLTSQLKRAVISVASNIAEGSARKSKRDQGHFYQIAYSSLMEVACQLMISVDLKLVDEDQHQLIKQEIFELSNKLNALHKRCLQPNGCGD